MALLPLQIPPGVYRNGTEYQASGRWRDANLVRWKNGVMGPVGGWQERDTVGTTAPRAAISWVDLNGNRRYAVGFHNSLKAVLASGVVTNITPASLVAGDLSAVVNTGFGGGFFGLGTFGTPRLVRSFGEATTWSLDTWGERLVACSTKDGRLVEWNLNVANDAVAIANAPINNVGLVVTAERFLFALGAGGNKRKVQWSDRENNTVWTPAATNEAGDFELQFAGEIMLGIKTRGQTLIITNEDAHTATYQGPPFVYGFTRVGSACGAVSRKSAVSVDEGVFWMGQSGFHLYSGGAVQDIPCEVADYVFSNINKTQASKVYGVSNQANNEIWWFYPSADSNENDRYVALNYAENHWSIGAISRTAGFDAGVFRNPIWFDTAGVAYDHESGFSHNGSVAFAESGPIGLGAGDNVLSATKLIPDEQTQGEVTAVFKTRFHPNDTLRSYGPYSMANPTSVRFTGRQVQMRVEGQPGLDWRVGVMRLDAVAGGLR
jgi:hypothetical protein